MCKLFNLTSKDIETNVMAENRQQAFAKFFLEVKQGKIRIDQLGGIVTSHEPEGDVPFRVTPTLWLMELITPEQAFKHIEDMLGLDPETDESATMLLNASKQDAWILDAIKELEN